MAKKKKPIMIAVAVLVIAAAGYRFGLPMVSGSGSSTAAVTTPTPEGPGPTLKLVERVLNVQTEGDTPRYVKLAVAVEFENTDPTFATLKGEALVAFEEEFAGEFAAYEPALADSVVTIVSAKSFAELNSAAGKEKLRGELKEAFTRILGEEHRIETVYFTTFVTQ
jgi:flagellar FliL protein